MARRKSNRAKTIAPVVKKSATPQAAIAGDTVCCMSAPNHCVPLLSTWRNPFPLLAIEAEHTPNASTRLPLFTDPRYGEPFHDYPGSLASGIPPTWMDPMLFVQQARADKEVLALLEKGLKDNGVDGPVAKQLAARLDYVFDNVHLPYLLAKFERAKPLLAEWLLLNHAARHAEAPAIEYQLKEAAKSRRRKRTKKAESEVAEEEDADALSETAA